MFYLCTSQPSPLHPPPSAHGAPMGTARDKLLRDKKPNHSKQQRVGFFLSYCGCHGFADGFLSLQNALALGTAETGGFAYMVRGGEVFPFGFQLAGFPRGFFLVLFPQLLHTFACWERTPYFPPHTQSTNTATGPLAGQSVQGPLRAWRHRRTHPGQGFPRGPMPKTRWKIRRKTVCYP